MPKGNDSDSTQKLNASSSGMQIAMQETVQTHFSHAGSCKPSQILLTTARVWVLSPTGRAIRVRALLDQGSNWTFMSRDLACALQVKTFHVSVSLSVVGAYDSGVVTSAAGIRISPNQSGSPAYKTEALVVPTITSYVPKCRAPTQTYAHLADLALADDPSNHDPIHLLIGGDLYGTLLLDGLKKGEKDEPIAQNTVFGWILSGKTRHLQSRNKQVVVSHHCISTKSLDSALQQFWEIEEMSCTHKLSVEDELCEMHFRQTHTRNSDGRYIVRIPFKTNPPVDIDESRYIAESSLKRLESRLEKNETHRAMYVTFMTEYAALNHMQLISDPNLSLSKEKPVYLPYHIVFREQSQTTKLRVVFNASCKTSNNTSLNDHMFSGPTLQSDLSTILLNWRSYKFVYTADIAKMYRQILVDPRDTEYQRILWRHSIDVPIQAYRLLTVTYGTRAAPFLALRVIRQLVEDEGSQYPLAAPILLHDTLVDDILFGAHDIHVAKETRDELVSLLSKAQFHARKWTSNSSQLLEDIDPSNHGLAWTAPLAENDGIKLLGVYWSPTKDSFHFHISLESVEPVTKRSVLSLLAKLFDPMGWVSPIIIVGKIFMQDLWKGQYAWDDPLPQQLTLFITNYFSSMSKLSQITIPRWTHSALSISDAQLHGFSDASEQAYGAVVYLRVTEKSSKVIVSLLASKTRVAPIKQLSIPRLELQAAVLLARLITSIRQARTLSNTPYQCWSDASIVLAWLSQHATKWKTFIANRVSEIQSLLPDCQWRHVPTDSNPADLASRGSSADDLVASDLWWSGPGWLCQSADHWPPNCGKVSNDIDFEEKLHVQAAHINSNEFE